MKADIEGVICAIVGSDRLTAVGPLCLAAPAEAASETKAGKHKKHATQTTKHRRAAAGFGYQNGVPRGPLYNGQDYLDDDPDLNIRSFLIRDKSRYGGVD
jgi:hypothetical protein